MSIVAFGIGNPLIDIVFHVEDDALAALSLDKGIMHLVSLERRQEILDHFSGVEPILRPGGSAPNTMLACGGLGIPSVISGKIGDDEFGRSYEKQVADYGITSRLVRGTRGDGATGSSIILITPDGERTMNTHLGMCQEYCRADLDEALLIQANFLYFTGYMWDTDVQKDAIRRAVRLARSNGVRVVFDVADPFAVSRYRDDFLALLANDVDVVFANRAEASILFDSENVDECVRRLSSEVEMGSLKMGKEGSITWENGRRKAVPGRPITPIDTTGAGDMYAAGFISSLAKGASAAEAAYTAGYLAEEIIQKVGAQFDLPEVKELRALLFGDSRLRQD